MTKFCWGLNIRSNDLEAILYIFTSRSAVREATQGKQVPWEASSLEGDFYFRAKEAAAQPEEAAAATELAL